MKILTLRNITIGLGILSTIFISTGVLTAFDILPYRYHVISFLVLALYVFIFKKPRKKSEKQVQIDESLKNELVQNE
ncbi:MAG: hypothetical protein K8R67_03940 [Desulfobacteraceae bacterium]|nr:hypothetical protein [Desulfobacteraceae bacterium]